MTLAPPQTRPFLSTSRVPQPWVSAVLVVHDGAQWLQTCLDAVAAQSRPPDRLIVVDTGSWDESLAIVVAHANVRKAVGDVRILRAPRETTFGAAVARAAAETWNSESTDPAYSSGDSTGSSGDSRGSTVSTVDGVGDRSGPQPRSADWLWLLHDDSAAAPLTLARLLDAARRSPSVGIAGPKLVQWSSPDRLLEVGQQVTRSGRRAAGPAPGELDQGQYDDRTDVLGVSTSGMLIRRDVFALLKGFGPGFALFADDLDLCWRAQLAGHRVVVVPAATMRDAAASVSGLRAGGPSVAVAQRLDRRQTRLVALSRCSILLAPLMALWIAVSALGSAVALVLLKRPRRALLELSDVAAVALPSRSVASRWRARGVRRVGRGGLAGLFVSGAAALRATLDALYDAVAVEGRTVRSTEQLETGPVAEEAQSLTVTSPTWPRRIARHPGFLVVMVTAALAAAAWRTQLTHGGMSPGGAGLSGGELFPLQSDARQLWHTWLDAWQGSGLGGGSEVAPYVAVLAGITWLVEHLPLLHLGESGSASGTGSAAGVTLAWLLLAAAPLSAWAAYLASRVTGAGRWARAWAALAWGTLGTLSAAAGSGRLGAVVAHIVLPLVVAGLACAARRRSTAPVTFGAALALAVLCAFDPPLATPALAAAALLILLGRGTARLRGLLLLLVPAALTGPWLLQYVHEPALLLTGPGLLSWGSPANPAWQSALLHVSGAPMVPGSMICRCVAAPIVLAGVAGLVRGGRSAVALWALAAAALVGLALALGAGHLGLATVPAGTPGVVAGATVAPWAGTGIDLAAGALIGAALLGSGGLLAQIRGTSAGRGARWRVTAAAPLLVLAVAGPVAAGALMVWQPVRALTATPALLPIAAEQVAAPVGGRVLDVSSAETAGGTAGSSGPGLVLDYALTGMEPGDLARDLPVAPALPDPTVAGAARALLSPVGSVPSGEGSASAQLADLGVGFISVRAPSQALAGQLDATQGLVRLSTTDGVTLWRVLPRTGTPQATPVPSSRARLESSSGALIGSVAVTGAHAALSARLGPGPRGRRLVLAEGPGWSTVARVSFDGAVLHAVPGRTPPTYALPATAGTLSVRVPPRHPSWDRVQLVLLALTVFLAVPLGNRRSRRPW